MNLIVCDDNAKICDDIKHYITDNFDCNVFSCNNEAELLTLIEADGDNIQAIILDIVLAENVNGIDVGCKIHKDYPDLKIVFLTGFDDLYYEKIFSEFQPYGFITKPIQYNILNFFVKKIELEYTQENKLLEFVSDYKEFKVPMKNIMFLQSKKRICEIVTEKEIFEAYLKISDVEMLLTDSFVRCHQSYIVNFKFAKRLENHQIIMKNNESIPISKKYYAKVKEAFDIGVR